jgi:pectate lyase
LRASSTAPAIHFANPLTLAKYPAKFKVDGANSFAVLFVPDRPVKSQPSKVHGGTGGMYQRLTLRLFAILGLLSIVGSTAAATEDRRFHQTRAVGYGEAATGGTIPCHVRDGTSLRACLGRGGALAIADIAFTFDPGRDRIAVAGNTTLDGRGILAITPPLYGLDIRSANVIIRNIVMHGNGQRKSILPNYPNANCTTPATPAQVFGCMAGIHIVGGGKNIWIDHNDFSNCGNVCIAIGDNNDGSGHPDRITVSNNIFRNSFFAVNVTVSGFAAKLPPPGYVTFYGNLFYRVFRRQPMIASGYEAHIFNNYYTGPICRGRGVGLGEGLGFGPLAEAGGEILFQNNVADPGSCGSHIGNAQFQPAPGNGVPKGYGKINATGNVGFTSDQGDSNYISLHPNRRDRDTLDFKPNYFYTLLPTDRVKASVLANAGILNTR